MIRVFIGYDPREAVAYSVLAHSIHEHASEPISITPLRLSQLTKIYSRPRDVKQSTDFAFTRFLVPYLCGYDGWAIFMDCDMLVMDDIAELWALRDERYAVQVVKHDHKPQETRKFLGMPQTRYAKKNWSSVMLLNCAKCQTLTPEYVGRASGLELHQFKWLENDDLVGELPHRWNWLVGYDPADIGASNVHFTLGGPYFTEYEQCEYADLWFQARAKMLNVTQHQDETHTLMERIWARSVLGIS